MSEGLEELQRIGTQEIHEHTHIPRASIEALINEDFSKMNRIQFNGFITILEREYSVDLSALKKSGLAYVEEHKNEKKVRTEYVTPKDNSAKFIYAVVALVVLFGAIYFTMSNKDEETQETYETQSEIVQSVEKEIIPRIKNSVSQSTEVVNDSNLSVESNSSKILDENITEIPKEVVAKITPVDTILEVTHKSKRWFGYVDLATHKKRDKIFKGTLDLNGSKDWLLISRPGAITFKIDKKTKKYKSSKNMRFKYIDKKLTKIRFAEWKKLNKGRVW